MCRVSGEEITLTCAANSTSLSSCPAVAELFWTSDSAARYSVDHIHNEVRHNHAEKIDGRCEVPTGCASGNQKVEKINGTKCTLR